MITRLAAVLVLALGSSPCGPLGAQADRGGLAVAAGPARWFTYGDGARPDNSNAVWGGFTRASFPVPGSSILRGAVSFGYAAPQGLRPNMIAGTIDIGVSDVPAWPGAPRLSAYAGVGLQHFDASDWEAVIEACDRNPLCFVEGPGGWATGTRPVMAFGAAADVPVIASFFIRGFAEARVRIGSSRAGPLDRLLPAVGIGIGRGFD